MFSKQDKSLHIAMYPWLAFGHLTSFLHFANKLAQRGHRVSFFLPTKTQPKLASHNHHPALITFIPITIPLVDGLPDGAETTNDVPASAQPLIMDAMDLTQPAIDSHLAQLKPDFIFFDFAHWIPSLARNHSARSVFFSITYMVSKAYFVRPRAQNQPTSPSSTWANRLGPPPGFPRPDIRLRAHEARALARLGGMKFGGGMTLQERHKISIGECDVVGVKTCREMEGVYCDYVEKHWDKPVLLAGPVVPEPPASRLDDRFDGWLNGFSHGSVVYCAFGSECVLEKDQFQELVLGLELTDRPFLAALRPPNGCETIEIALPEGFLERTKGRGMVHGGWVQQQLILHHPSVGCFMTHSGPGSLSEAMLSECQLVLVPYAFDQFIIAKMMSLDLKVGVEIEKREEDGFFTKEAVLNAITMVMDPQSELGRELRANHTKLRRLLRDGLEDAYVNGFVQGLRNLLP